MYVRVCERARVGCVLTVKPLAFIACGYVCIVQALQHAVDEFVAARKPHSATTNILANALHAVFTIPACDDGTRCIIQDACYDYLSKQGMRTQGPVGLLAGCVVHD